MVVSMSAKTRRDMAEAHIREMKAARMADELVDVEELAKRMSKPLAAMKQVVTGSVVLGPEDKTELLEQIRELYGSIFGAHIVSPKLKEFIKKNKIELPKAEAVE